MKEELVEQTQDDLDQIKITRSKIDDREFKPIKLDNGMVFLLVHDKNCDIAGAAVDCCVGSM